MSPAVLRELHRRFAAYADRFRSDDLETDAAIRLKAAHTLRVVDAIRDLARELGLSPGGGRLAEATALLHDVGRFRQYERYGTYLDAASENHAELGVRVIREENLLKGVDSGEVRLIERAVGLHNVARLPDDEDPTERCFLRLLRDADKLDIWKVVLDHYYERGEERSRAVGLGLPNTPECSPGVVEALRREDLVEFTDIRTLTDFKLMQLGWVYDLNFAPTFARVRRERYVEQMADVLPKTGPVPGMIDAAAAYIAEMERAAPACFEVAHRPGAAMAG